MQSFRAREAIAVAVIVFVLRVLNAVVNAAGADILELHIRIHKDDDNSNVR